MIIYGVPRNTFDLDLLIEPTVDSWTRTFRALAQVGFKGVSTMDPEWAYQMTKYAVFNSLRIDIHAGTTLKDFNKAWERRTIEYFEGIKMNVISIPDLIDLKRHTGRKQDAEDIDNLEAILSNYERGA